MRTLQDPFASQRKWGVFLLIMSGTLTILLILSVIYLLILNVTDLAPVPGLDAAALLPFGGFMLHRYKVAQARQKYVSITKKQYPEVFRIAEQLAKQAGLPKTPPVFLVRDPAVDPCTLNPGLRSSLVLGSDFLAGCRENNTPDAIRFMLAHQIGHMVAGHHKPHWVFLTATTMGTVGLKTIIVRNLEFTADAYAAKVSPDGAVDALALCATGKDNYPYVNPKEETRFSGNTFGIMPFIAKWTLADVSPLDRLKRLDIDNCMYEENRHPIPDHHEVLPQAYLAQFDKD